MNVVNVDALEEFGLKHAAARSSLRHWLTVAQSARWKNVVSARATFNSVDEFTINDKRVTVFNIGGNKYRLIAHIQYQTETISVRFVLTHAEYDRESWKKKI